MPTRALTCVSMSAAYFPYKRKILVPPPVEVTWFDVFNQNRDLDQPQQVYSWTCSACATQWVLHATGLDQNITREQTVYKIGYPEQINENVGLTNRDGPGEALIDVFESYGVAATHGWLDFDTVYELAQRTAIAMSGAAWYHWVAVRGISGSSLWIANSALGYKGVYDTLSRSQFDNLGGFSVVYLER